jgi:hypothetical protein
MNLGAGGWTYRMLKNATGNLRDSESDENELVQSARSNFALYVWFSSNIDKDTTYIFQLPYLHWENYETWFFSSR